MELPFHGEVKRKLDQQEEDNAKLAKENVILAEEVASSRARLEDIEKNLPHYLDMQAKYAVGEPELERLKHENAMLSRQNSESRAELDRVDKRLDGVNADLAGITKNYDELLRRCEGAYEKVFGRAPDRNQILPEIHMIGTEAAKWKTESSGMKTRLERTQAEGEWDIEELTDGTLDCWWRHEHHRIPPDFDPDGPFINREIGDDYEFVTIWYREELEPLKIPISLLRALRRRKRERAIGTGIGP